MGKRPEGAVDFTEFMEAALYDRELGYYMRDASIIGEKGDFITAPQMSPLFSHALARQIAQIIEPIVNPIVLEIGAGTGAMAVELLRELARLDRLPDQYQILERSPALRERQRKSIEVLPASLVARVAWVDEASAMRGAVVANELFDALAVSRFVMCDGRPQRLRVRACDEGFEWCEGPLDIDLESWLDATRALRSDPLPDGYVSEWCPELPAALGRFTNHLEEGAALFLDYGYAHSEYYHLQRTDGTLLCHFEHRAHADPLVLVGLQDLTASVDFTALGVAARQQGLEVAGYTSQTWFLMGCGLEDMVGESLTGVGRAEVETAAALRRLLLPGEMGERVKVIALSRGESPLLDGFKLRDQSGRLGLDEVVTWI
jgi:SAM-dependent MidA family methyltransferase